MAEKTTDVQPVPLSVDDAQLGARVLSRGSLAALAVFLVLFLFLWGCPNYDVYRARKAGEAKAAEALGEAEALRVRGKEASADLERQRFELWRGWIVDLVDQTLAARDRAEREVSK